ncbi:TraI domain-containing protein [Paraburkholderia sp. GAS32]|uniref:TraI domain-containing protein n=1 Tax=Paraburkholderia sp. GAS32 TaxID=3035129 RepID=UPI003D254D68
MTLHTPKTADALLAEHARRVDLIAQCANETGRPEFDRKWRAILQRCASWFSSLPLNPDLYREPGGAFRCTVETAFYSMRLAGGQKFGTNLPSERRRRIEPQYNYAVFLAAVCSRLDEPYRHFEIERDSDRQQWNPSVHGEAAAWLANGKYRVSRRARPLPVERMRTGMLAQVLIGSELLSGLDAEVLSDLFGAINPSMQPLAAESLLHKVVRQGVGTADEFDRKAQRAVFAPVQFDVPSAVHVAAELEPVTTPAQTPSPAPASPAPAAPAPPAGPETGATATPHQGQTETQAPVVSSVPAALAPQAEPTAVPHVEQATGRGPQSLHEAVGITASPASSTAVAAPPAVDPSAMKSGPVATSREARATPPETSVAQAADEVLKGVPNLIRELFQAMREDVAAGKEGVKWSDKGLVIQKRLIGSYGVASSTLVEHMRKRSLMVADEATQITLIARAGQLILDRPT